MRLFLIICAAIAITGCAGTGKKAAITTDELSVITGRLASEKFQGRGTGTSGDSLAALYIRDELKKAGARPFSGNGLQPFSVNVAVEPGSNNRLSVNGIEYAAGTDFMPLALSDNASLEAPWYSAVTDCCRRGIHFFVMISRNRISRASGRLFSGVILNPILQLQVTDV